MAIRTVWARLESSKGSRMHVCEFQSYTPVDRFEMGIFGMQNQTLDSIDPKLPYYLTDQFEMALGFSQALTVRAKRYLTGKPIAPL